MAMFTFDLVIHLANLSFEDIRYASENLLSYLRANNQIINEDDQFILENNQLRMPVTCPQPNSLDASYGHKFVLPCLEQVQILTQRPLEIRPTGRAADRLTYQVPVGSTSYILFGRGFSPVICGDSFQEVPLYLLPALNPEANSYQDLNLWHYAYQALDQLWLVSGYGERYALQQLQQVGSPFSEQGRSLCQRLEHLTGVPTYYFLSNRRNWSETQDRAQSCPLTGKAWLLEDSTFNDMIGFRCEESRLVSQLSSMVRRRQANLKKL
jgi:predicted  nucleic acid-binding Zn ribbon protein